MCWSTMPGLLTRFEMCVAAVISVAVYCGCDVQTYICESLPAFFLGDHLMWCRHKCSHQL